MSNLLPCCLHLLPFSAVTAPLSRFATSEPSHELDLSDELKAKQDSTIDFVFCLAGDTIPILPTSFSPLPLFDLRSPPACSLTVSNRHTTVFLAHSKWLMAVRKKEMIEATKEVREKGNVGTRCAHDYCITDVPLLGVSLLVLSRDKSMLAACIDSEIQFFSSASLHTHKVILFSLFSTMCVCLISV
ncbi:nuclear pore complex protein NUP214-like [Phragmites australis]|uniref:nuclear pore complex protein NUP214-like n=1 Tax=Phragmites australis TaxID=29695 RepID=UPI002D785245|nr:nuclear pore complex protein NUP214-like [Phragmites australis]